MRDNINLTIPDNPLIGILEFLLKCLQLRKLSPFGEMVISPSQFNMTNEIKFGHAFLPDLFQFFNVCGEIIQTQAKWWQSNLIRNITSRAQLKLLKEGIKCS